MALPIGLTTAGLQIPTVDDIIEDIKAEMLANVSATLDFSTALLLYQIVAAFAERIAIVCELLQAIYSSQDPDAATGDALESLAKLTGTLRDPARASTVTLTLTGTPTTNVAAGSRARNAALVEFATDELRTIAAATAWASSTAYALDVVRTNASRIYKVIIAGTSAGSGGPTTQAADIADGTVHWKYIGEGTGYVDAAATCTVTGPFDAFAGTVSEIVTPVAGWSTVTNQLDATPGANIEVDESLRARREDELAGAGVSPADAIRAALLEVDDVTSVTVFVNFSDVTNGDGMPPHSVEALVRGGDDQDIFDTLHASVAAGIQTVGTTTGAVIDSSGTELAYEFSRPDEIEIHVQVNLSYYVPDYPEDGDAQVEAAIVAWGDALATGRDVKASAVVAQCFKIAGVLDVTVAVGTTVTPVDPSVTITSRQLAVFDTSRITVVASGTLTP